MTTDIENKIHGELTDTNLDALLAMIRSSLKTGVLKLKYSDSRYNTNYTFFQGIAGQVKTLFAAKISTIMKDYGVPDNVIEHLRGYKLSHTRSKLMITLNDGSQALSSDLIAKAFKRRMLISLVPILERTDGNFELNLSQQATLTTKKGVDPVSISLEASRRLDELNTYNKEITSLGPDDAFVITEENANLSVQSQGFNAYEIRLLSIASEPITLLEAGIEARLSWDELLRAIATLVERKIINYVPNSNRKVQLFSQSKIKNANIDEFSTLIDEGESVTSSKSFVSDFSFKGVLQNILNRSPK